MFKRKKTEQKLKKEIQNRAGISPLFNGFNKSSIDVKTNFWSRWKLRKERKRVKEILNYDTYKTQNSIMTTKDRKNKAINKAIERIQESSPVFDDLKKRESKTQKNPIKVLKRRGIKTHTITKHWNVEKRVFEEHLHIIFSNGQELTISSDYEENNGAKFTKLIFDQHKNTNNVFGGVSCEFTCKCGKMKGWISQGKETPACPECGRRYIGEYDEKNLTISPKEIEKELIDE